MAIETPAPVDTLPPAPDDTVNIGDDFNTVANAYTAAIPPWGLSVDAIGLNVYNNALEAEGFATTASSQAVAAANSASSASGFATDAENSAVASAASAQDALDYIATIPAGTLNDAITSPTNTWSSDKITQEIEASGTSFETVATGSLASGDLVSLLSDGSVQLTQNNPDSVGPVGVFNSAGTNYCVSVSMDSTTLVVAYQDTADSSYGKAVVGVISGDTINFGAEATFNSGDTRNISIDKIDSTRFVVAYRNSGSSSHGTAIAGTVSGMGVLFNALDAEVFNSAVTVTSSVKLIDTDKILVAYGNSAAEGRCVVGTISGTSIVFAGTSYQFHGSSVFPFVSLSLIDTNKCLISFTNGTTNAQSRVCEVVGEAITFGSSIVFNNDNTPNASAATIASNKVAIAYQDAGNSNRGTAIIATISGNSVSFAGAESVFESGTTVATGICADELGGFIVTYVTGLSSYYVIGTVVGSTISPSVATNFSGNASTLSPTFISSDKIAISRALSNTSGDAVILDTAADNTSRYIGISASSALDTEPVSVKLLGAIDDNQTGLTIGSKYYLDTATAALTTTDTGVEVGKALSPTKILITGAGA